MALKMVDGDYVKAQDGSLEEVDYTDELLQNAEVLLNTRRGRFYPNKSFGRRLVGERIPAEQYALEYARQALASLSGVFVKGAFEENGETVITLLINSEERQVRIKNENL
jgi:hypothetical protein